MIMDVYDKRYDWAINQSIEQLGIQEHLDPNLALHPLATDYMQLTNLRPDSVNRHLRDAILVLREEVPSRSPNAPRKSTDTATFTTAATSCSRRVSPDRKPPLRSAYVQATRSRSSASAATTST